MDAVSHIGRSPSIMGENRVKDIAIRDAAKLLIDAKYCLGQGEGFDCISILHEFYGRLNVHLPAPPEGWTLENYAEKWKAGEGRDELAEYLMSIGSEVPTNYERSGDMMIFDGKQCVFPGIYLGNGHFLAAFERGVMVVPLRFFRNILFSTRRVGVGDECQQR